MNDTTKITRVSNSREARLAIEAVDRKELNEEIEYRLELQRENEDNEDDFDDWLLALLDAEEFAENTLSGYDKSRTLLTACRRALIKLGKYRVITAGELARTQTLGGKKFDFQLGGKKYVWCG